MRGTSARRGSAADGGVHAPAEPSVGGNPIPRRWLKRLKILGVVVILGLVGLRLGWGYIARERLRESLALMDKQQEAMVAAVKKLQTATPPAGESALEIFERGEAAIVTELASGETLEELYDLSREPEEATADDLARIREMLAANRVALEAARSGRYAMERYGPPNPPPSPIDDARHKAKPPWRRLLTLAVNDDMQAGEHASAIERMRDMAALEKYMHTVVAENPSFLGYKFAWTFDELVQRSAAGLVLEDDATASGRETNAGVEPASGQQARALLSEIEDDLLLRLGLASLCHTLPMMRAEALEGLESLFPSVDAVGSGEEWAYLCVWLPSVQLESVRQVKVAHLAAAATLEGRWPTGNPGPAFAFSDSPISRYAFPTTGGEYRYTLRAVWNEARFSVRSLARRRMVVAALAIVLFKHDHGCCPVKLDELSPTYLKSVPVDPFDPDGAALRYRTDGQYFMLYSIGPNGTDDGGSPGERFLSAVDPTFELDGMALSEIEAAQPTSSEASDNDTDEEDRPR